MENNQIWIQYEGEVMINFSIIEAIEEWQGESVARLCGQVGVYRKEFFNGMELLKNLTDVPRKEDAAKILDACRAYNNPIPGSTVRIDRFKNSGKWYETLELVMDKYWNETFVHDAVKKALKDQYPNLKPIDAREKSTADGFLICLQPFNACSFPVTIWLS